MSAQSALVTTAEYLEGELVSKIRHEFVGGSVYAMAGASRNHLEITAQLSWMLRRDLAGKHCRNLDQDTKVWVEATNSYYYPDATISCPPNFTDDRYGVIDNPTVVFEVLSPSTANLDKGAKFAAYRTLNSLRDYVTIDSESRQVEVYSLEADRWVVRFFAAEDAIVEIPSVGIRFPVDEIYAHAVFGQ